MGLFDFFRRKSAASKPLTKDELRALPESIRTTPARKVSARKVPAPKVAPARSHAADETPSYRRDDGTASSSMLDPLNPLSPLNDTYYSSAPCYTPDPTTSCDTSSSYYSSSDSSSYPSSSDSCSYDSSSSSSSDSESW
jgi:hypothetical protein